MGGDAAFTQEDGSLRLGATPKVFEAGDFLIGVSGSKRVCQIVCYELKLPKHDPRLDVEKYMVVKFARALRKAMQDGGCEVDDENEGKTINGMCLVGYQGRLFQVDSAYGVAMSLPPYAAIGCADQIALGAMHALRTTTPEKMVRAALEASAEFDVNIRPPFTIKSIK
jgi:ATP-dependent protease HslVU (ClpYQ) peptidase subunit